MTWDQINVIHGPPKEAYFNGAVAALALPISDYNLSGFQSTALEAMTVFPKALGIEVTGASTSTQDAYDKLRAEDGQVIHTGGTALAYTDLAEVTGDPLYRAKACRQLTLPWQISVPCRYGDQVHGYRKTWCRYPRARHEVYQPQDDPKTRPQNAQL